MSATRVSRVMPSEAWRYQVDADMTESEMRRVVGAAMCSLHPRDERIIRLHYFAGRTIKDIADMIGVSPERARQCAIRAEKRLRQNTWPAAKWLLADPSN